jgi:hypothetical protein
MSFGCWIGMVCDGQLFLWDWLSGAETLKKRQAMRHDCLPSLLGDGDKLSEIVSAGLRSPTNQPREDPFHTYSMSPHLSQFQQVNRGHPSLVFLVRRLQ